MSRSTSKIPFYVKKGSERASGYLSLMCRPTVGGGIKQFSCKLDVPPKLQDVKTTRTTGKSVEVQKINAAIDWVCVDVNRHYQELMQPDGYVTAAKLRDACLRLSAKCETLLKFFEQHNEEFTKKVGHSRVQGTHNCYHTIHRHLCEFVPKVYRRDDIPLKEPNLTFINNFEYFLCMEKKCRTNTVRGYMIGPKHVISIARNSGVLPFNPFTGYINSPESVDRDYPTEYEIQTLMETPAESRTCELVRDLFILSVSTGLAYADVKAPTTDRLQTFFNGNLWIITRRRKTNTKPNTRLLDVFRHIIEKYKGLSKNGYVFPVSGSSRCNTILKELGRQCGFKIRLTYHAAWYTNATTVLLLYGVPIEAVSRFLRYTDLKTTQIYARVTNQRISSDIKILSHKLEKMEKEICDAI